MRSLFSLIAIVAAGALFFLYTKPAYDSVKMLQADIAEYDQALTKAAELQRLKQSLLSRFNSFNPADVERLHKLLPDHVDNVRLVLDLDTLASKHALALQNVVISEASEVTSDDVTSIGSNAEKYDSLTLRFATQGTYQRFVDFVTDLESSLRVVDVVALSIAQSQEAPGVDPVYRFDMTVRTYWLK